MVVSWLTDPMKKWIFLFNFFPLLFVSTLMAQEWKVIGRFGDYRTVYAEPEGLKDKQFVAQVLHAITAKEGIGKPIIVMFFNDKRLTPGDFL